MEAKAVFAVALVWVIIFIVPILVYGVFSAVTGLQPPGGSPTLFLIGTAIAKLGTAIAFVSIFLMAKNLIGSQWLVYVGIWWIMFVIGEVGQAVTPTYSWQEAAAGVISETIYFPVSGLIVVWLLIA